MCACIGCGGCAAAAERLRRFTHAANGLAFRRHIGRRRSQDGRTALICAAAKGHADCALLLLVAGADKEAKDKGGGGVWGGGCG